ncbi:t-SNARE coiled-coil-like proteiny domain-containing protein [Entamoeba marina]
MDCAEKIRLQENRAAAELKEATIIGKQLAENEQKNIKEQDAAINSAYKDAEQMKDNAIDTKKHIDQSRENSCKSRKWFIIGGAIAALIALIVIIIVVVIIVILVAK